MRSRHKGRTVSSMRGHLQVVRNVGDGIVVVCVSVFQRQFRSRNVSVALSLKLYFSHARCKSISSSHKAHKMLKWSCISRLEETSRLVLE